MGSSDIVECAKSKIPCKQETIMSTVNTMSNCSTLCYWDGDKSALSTVTNYFVSILKDQMTGRYNSLCKSVGVLLQLYEDFDDNIF